MLWVNRTHNKQCRFALAVMPSHATAVITHLFVGRANFHGLGVAGAGEELDGTKGPGEVAE
jgi:hypothetical protein